METEYEYLYVGGTMEIDKVIRQSRRKQVLVMDLSEMLVLAPEGSRRRWPMITDRCRSCGLSAAIRTPGSM